eukprot:888042-Amphidinium_carterae.1
MECNASIYSFVLRNFTKVAHQEKNPLGPVLGLQPGGCQHDGMDQLSSNPRQPWEENEAAVTSKQLINCLQQSCVVEQLCKKQHAQTDQGVNQLVPRGVPGRKLAINLVWRRLNGKSVRFPAVGEG